MVSGLFSQDFNFSSSCYMQVCFISMKYGVMELVLFYIHKILETRTIVSMPLKWIEIIFNTNMSVNIIVLLGFI